MNKEMLERSDTDGEFVEPFSSDSIESLEIQKEKRIYSLCIIFLPILIIILLL